MPPSWPAARGLFFLSTSRVYPARKLNALVFREETDRFALTDEQFLPGSSGCGINEDFPLDGARSLYGMTKLASELMIAEYADAYGLGCAINRYGLIAGPGQMGKTDQGVIALWVAAHYFRRPLSYIGFGGQGKQVRDVLHIDDLCELVIDQVLHPDRYQGRVFNAGGGASFAVSLRELTLCREITGNGWSSVRLRRIVRPMCAFTSPTTDASANQRLEPSARSPPSRCRYLQLDPRGRKHTSWYLQRIA